MGGCTSARFVCRIGSCGCCILALFDSETKSLPKEKRIFLVFKTKEEVQMPAITKLIDYRI